MHCQCSPVGRLLLLQPLTVPENARCPCSCVLFLQLLAVPAAAYCSCSCLQLLQLLTLPATVGDVRDLVAVYKNPPYPVFYDVVYHSYALVPMLASPLYYQSKFSSTVLTSFITGEQAVSNSAVF